MGERETMETAPAPIYPEDFELPADVKAIRDQFAETAMAELYRHFLSLTFSDRNVHYGTGNQSANMSFLAYNMADAMLAERAKP